MDRHQLKKKSGRGEFFSTGENTEEQIIGKCSICGQETLTNVRHKKTKQIIGKGCVSDFCKPKKDKAASKRIFNLLDANKVKEI